MLGEDPRHHDECRVEEALPPTGDGQMAAKDANLGGHQLEKSIPGCALRGGAAPMGRLARMQTLLAVQKLDVTQDAPLVELP